MATPTSMLMEAITTRGGKYLAFSLSKEGYELEILKAPKIIEWVEDSTGV